MKEVRLIYKSSPAESFKGAAIEDILECSRVNNAKHNVTGALYFSRYFFFQVLEGDVATINALYQKILNDPRHSNCLLMDYGTIDKRIFTEWSMGYVSENLNVKNIFNLDDPKNKIDFFNYSHEELINIILDLKNILLHSE